MMMMMMQGSKTHLTTLDKPSPESFVFPNVFGYQGRQHILQGRVRALPEECENSVPQTGKHEEPNTTLIKESILGNLVSV